MVTSTKSPNKKSVTHMVSSFVWVSKSHRVRCYIISKYRAHAHGVFVCLGPTVPQTMLLYYFQLKSVTHMVSSFVWVSQSHRVCCYIISKYGVSHTLGLCMSGSHSPAEYAAILFLSTEYHAHGVLVCLGPTVPQSMLLYYF